MADMEETSSTPTLEVRVLRDGIVIQRELCESDAAANAVVEAWSDVDGVVCEVEDLTRSNAPGVLDPRPWEVDADDAGYEDLAEDDDQR
jgi:hypothetical protein